MTDLQPPVAPELRPSNASSQSVSTRQDVDEKAAAAAESQQSVLPTEQKHAEPTKSNRKTAYIVGGVVVAAIVIAGAVAGGVLGSRAARNSSSSSNAASSGTASGNGETSGGEGGGSITNPDELPSDFIDPDTAESVRTRTGSDGMEYELVFSDEFNKDGRTFNPGDEKYWEGVDLHYAGTEDLEWYDPRQITTRNGSLVITMDAVTTTQANLSSGSTAPFTAAENHGFDYRSGMLQSWNKFCFTTGYIEVAVVLPGVETSTGYWPGVWTMGNLGRPGYLGSTDGMWPYSYDTCDLGTFPNQTTPDKLGPPAALRSDKSNDEYNFELSYLTGQRASACTCPGADHPGPSVDKGRGSPEIDVLEASGSRSGGLVSQSAQFAPFNADYAYISSPIENYEIYNASKSHANGWQGSPVQQAISTLSKVPSDGYQNGGERFVVYGFEYWSNPNNRSEGYITWNSDGALDAKITPGAVGPDSSTQIGQRLISEEPMSIILNLGISRKWGNVDVASLVFPSEMLVDYVRVYQRKGSVNVGCDPKDYPTADYIKRHENAYTNATMQLWPNERPKNRLYDGC